MKDGLPLLDGMVVVSQAQGKAIRKDSHEYMN